MANDYIKQFLVGLGWDVDEAGMHRFATSIAVQTEVVRALGEGIKAAADKVVGFVKAAVRSNDDIYFLSQRLQASAVNIKALKYAAEQTGGSGFFEALIAQAQALKNHLETLPGLEARLQGLGINTRDENGQLRDRIEIYRDFAAALNRLQGPQKYAFAQQLGGIDPTTLDLIQSGKFEHFFEEQKARSASNADAASGDANRIETAYRRLQTQIQTLADKAIVGLMDAWDSLSAKTKQQIEDWLNVDQWASRIEPQIRQLATAIKRDLAQAWQSLSPETRRTIQDFADLEQDLRRVADFFDAIVNKIRGVIDWFHKLGISFDDSNFQKVVKWLNRDDGTHVPAPGTPAKNDKRAQWVKALAGDPNAIADYLYRGMVALGQNPNFKKESVSPTAPGKASGSTLGIRDNNPGNLQPGGTEKVFATAQEGLNALTDNLVSYAKKGRDTVASIIGAWAPEYDQNGRKINNTPEYIRFVSQQLHASPEAHLAMNDPEILANLARAIELFENNRQNPYSAEMYSAAAKQALSDGAGKTDVAIHQTVTTTVNGASDAKAAAAAVSDGMKDGTNMLVRSLQNRTS